jgi:hypothetical protein
MMKFLMGRSRLTMDASILAARKDRRNGPGIQSFGLLRIASFTFV